MSRGRGGQRYDNFRARKQNTSRPPSMHVDDFMAMEGGRGRGRGGASQANDRSAQGPSLRKVILYIIIYFPFFREVQKSNFSYAKFIYCTSLEHTMLVILFQIQTLSRNTGESQRMEGGFMGDSGRWGITNTPSRREGNACSPFQA